MAGRLTQRQIRGDSCTAALAIAAALISLSFATGQAKPPAPSARDQIHEWIADLGDDSFAVRETATRQLTAAGVTAMRAVADAATSADPEVAWRARAILKGIAETDGASVPVLSELERTSSVALRPIVRSILELPAVQERLALFMQELKQDLEAELERSRDELILGQTEAARRRLHRIQALDQQHSLFAAPNPILVVVACLEVEAAGEDFRAGDVENRHEKVDALMHQARLDVLAGRWEPARRFAVVANKLGVTPDRQTDPRLLLAEIESTDLLQQAREDVAAGRLADARKKVLAVQQTDRQFGLFAFAVTVQTRAMLVLFHTIDLDGAVQLLSAKPEELVAALLESAAADLKSRQLNRARSKAALAEALDVDERARFFLKDIDDLLKSSDHRQLVAGRLLEISQEFAAEGDMGQARNWLAHIVRVYPTTEASQIAGRLLNSLP